MAKSKQFKSEQELAAHVVKWLEDQEYDVYQEVPLLDGGATADIVAVSGRIVWIVECKLSFGLSVLNQAQGWYGRAHFRSVAVPDGRDQGFAKMVAAKFGIGVITVSNDYGVEISQPLKPEFRRNTLADQVLAKLKPEHKTYAKAGAADGKAWTPYKHTCSMVLEAVKKEPGMTMKELMNKVQTHYASPMTARVTLVKRIEKRLVPGVRIEREGRLIRLYPE